MRRKTTHHVTDLEILQAMDGELSRKRMLEVRNHLAVCTACRTLRLDIGNRLAQCTGSDKLENNSEFLPMDMARRRLSMELADLAGRSRVTPVEQALQWLFSTRAIAYASAGMAVILTYLILGPFGAPQLHAALIPDMRLTPGATRRITKEEVCMEGVNEVHAVPSTLALRVFQEYGIPNPTPRTYEVDYLISPALGGAADIRNLWPQPYADGTWNSHVKDALEDRLRALVCDGTLDLDTAQRDISRDWISAYKKYFATNAPLEIHAGFALDAPWE